MRQVPGSLIPTHRATRHAAALALMLWAASAIVAPQRAEAFCGFYVSGGTTKLYNNATQVALMREGTRTVLSMRNNYQGPAQDFAMVVPVPVVLKKEQVKTLNDALFDKLDALGAPRLVQYWEQDPCPRPRPMPRYASRPMRAAKMDMATGAAPLAPKRPAVRIEAQFKQGEYDIVILSATESNALETWLRQNKYNIPKGAASVLKGYVQQGMYFFVAKVDIAKVKVDASGKTMLSPLRFSYDTRDFQLPVRLGLLNANGKQDLIVTILAKNQRYEVANAKNVTIPTNLIVDGAVKSSFGEFYAELFDYTLKENPGAVVTEYAWDATKCDPCPAGNFGGRNIGGPLSYQDLQMLGLDMLSPENKRYGHSMSDNTTIVSGKAPEKMTALLHDIRGRVQSCEAPMGDAATRDTRNGNMRLRITVDPRDGRASALVTQESHNPTQNIASCVAERIGAIDSALIKSMGMDQPLVLDMHTYYNDNAYVQNQWQLSQGWTMTRLHARYDSKDLKDDLVFRTAKPIIGGRGTPYGADGKLQEEGAKESSMNNFQGRYIILNPWKGQVACKNPQRGVWGYPPNGQAWQPKPAQDLAFAKRGKVKLSSTIKSKDQPGLPWHKKK